MCEEVVSKVSFGIARMEVLGVSDVENLPESRYDASFFIIPEASVFVVHLNHIAGREPEDTGKLILRKMSDEVPESELLHEPETLDIGRDFFSGQLGRVRRVVTDLDDITVSAAFDSDGIRIFRMSVERKGIRLPAVYALKWDAPLSSFHRTRFCVCCDSLFCGTFLFGFRLVFTPYRVLVRKFSILFFQFGYHVLDSGFSGYQVCNLGVPDPFVDLFRHFGILQSLFVFFQFL